MDDEKFLRGSIYRPEDGTMETKNSSHNEVPESAPFCFFTGMVNTDLCITIELSICMILTTGILFAYQVVYVWVYLYKVGIVRERRVQMMILGAVYCGISASYYFNHGESRVYLWISLAYMHFQICGLTVLYFFDRVMQILPEVKLRWTRWLYVLHVSNSIVLFGLGTAQLVKMEDGAVEHSMSCALNEFFAFQLVVLSHFFIMMGMTLAITARVNRIEVVSRINRFVNLQYLKHIGRVRFIIIFQVLV
jgi:hypothetical protein